MVALLEQGEKHNQFEIQDLVWGKFFPNIYPGKTFLASTVAYLLIETCLQIGTRNYSHITTNKIHRKNCQTYEIQILLLTIPRLEANLVWLKRFFTFTPLFSQIIFENTGEKSLNQKM